MGGDWIPDHLVPIDPNPWKLLAKAVDPDRFYRFALVHRSSPTTKDPAEEVLDYEKQMQDEDYA